VSGDAEPALFSSSSVHCDDIKAADRSARRLAELVDLVSPCGDSGVYPRFPAVVYSQVPSVRETARQLDVPLYPFLRRICTEVLSAEGVTTRLPLGTARLRG